MSRTSPPGLDGKQPGQINPMRWFSVMNAAGTAQHGHEALPVPALTKWIYTWFTDRPLVLSSIWLAAICK